MRRSLQHAGLLAIVVSLLGCNPKHKTTAPEVVATETAPPEPAPIRLDGTSMDRDVTFLASDDLAGRHTLEPGMQQAADYVVERYREIGLLPFGDDFRREFELPTDGVETGATELSVSGKKPKAAKAGSLVPLGYGKGGTTEGELVFAGYAARAEAIPADPDAELQGHPAYDDLAGVDLNDKIALVLLDAPARPNVRATFERIQAIAEDYAAEVKPLLEGGKGKAALKLHSEAIERLARLVAPYMRGNDLPQAFVAVPESAPPELDMQGRLGPVMAATSDLPGPQFGMREGSIDQKLDRLADAGVKGVVFVRGPASQVGKPGIDPLPTPGTRTGYDPARPFPVAQMSWREADRLLRVGGKKLSKVQAQIDAKFEPRSGPTGLSITLTTGVKVNAHKVPNLVARIKGTKRPDEIVMIGAHLDHVGTAGDSHGMCAQTKRRGKTDSICNGADDNASGSAMVLAVAQALKQGPPPERTVVFAHFAGEEMGLLGSKAMAADPDFPNDKIVAMVNLDMVGHLGTKGLAIGGISSSPGWMPMLDEIGTGELEKILYEGSIASRSDHASFFRLGIPVLFFFTGTHGNYHRPGDEKVNLEGMVKIGDLVLGVVERLAAGSEIPLAEGAELSNTLPGQDPDTVIKVFEVDG